MGESYNERASEVTVACAQLALRVGEPDANRKAAAEAIAAAAAGGAQVVVLPELTNSGYVFSSADEATELAEGADGPTISSWSELANSHDLVIVGGICERGSDGLVYNSAALIDASGLRQMYRKPHLWNRERDVFSVGSSLSGIVSTKYGKIACAICYDIYFPEVVRSAALRGAELIAIPTNAPKTPLPGEPPPAAASGFLAPVQLSIYMAYAHINKVFIAACDRTGSERGVDWVGGSAIVDPTGWLVAPPPPGYGAGVISARCEFSQARDKWRNERNNVVTDRREELYSMADTKGDLNHGG